jgi:hypothetical protein
MTFYQFSTCCFVGVGLAFHVANNSATYTEHAVAANNSTTLTEHAVAANNSATLTERAVAANKSTTLTERAVAVNNSRSVSVSGAKKQGRQDQRRAKLAGAKFVSLSLCLLRLAVRTWLTQPHLGAMPVCSPLLLRRSYFHQQR